jgi:hypothetical protein
LQVNLESVDRVDRKLAVTELYVVIYCLFWLFIKLLDWSRFCGVLIKVSRHLSDNLAQLHLSDCFVAVFAHEFPLFIVFI